MLWHMNCTVLEHVISNLLIQKVFILLFDELVVLFLRIISVEDVAVVSIS